MNTKEVPKQSWKTTMIKVKVEDLSLGKEMKCPAATQDLKLNTKNRDASIKAEHIQYGPLNVDEPGDYWKDIAEYWNTTEEAAKKSNCGNCTAFDKLKNVALMMHRKTEEA